MQVINQGHLKDGQGKNSHWNEGECWVEGLGFYFYHWAEL